MKRLLAWLLSLVMILSLIPAAAAEDIEIIEIEPEDPIDVVVEEPITEPGDELESSKPTITEPGEELEASKPTITASPQSVTAYVGTTAKFTVIATGAESYQWYYRTSAEGEWKESTTASATTATLSVVAETFRSGYQYYCKVRNSAGTSYTRVATLTVTVKPLITTQPADKSAQVGQTVKFTVKAKGADAYQWYYRTSASGSWSKSTAESASTATLSVTAETKRNGYQYRCKLTNAKGSVYSEAATLTVEAIPVPVITKQPADVTAVAGTEAQFSVAATGADAYQWYYRTSASGSWSKSTAESASTVTLTVAAETKRDGYQYRCKVSNAGGSVYTEAATLTVEAIPVPVITKQPKDFTASTGTDAYFRVTATDAAAYQWYYRTSASGTWSKCTANGATGPALTVKAEAKRNGYQYRCKVSNAGGYVYSDAATLKTAGNITYRALLIGEVHFSWETAKRNESDVLLMSSMLNEIDAAYGGRYEVTSAYDLDNNGIRNAISSAFAGADDNDVSLFFIATHGVVNVPSGAEAGALVTIAVPGSRDDYLLLGQLAAWLKDVPGKVIVLLGSCGSGAAIVNNGTVSYVPSSSGEYEGLFNDYVISAFDEQNEMIPVSDDGVISNTGEFRSSKFYVLTAAAHMESSWGMEGETLTGSYNYFTTYLAYGIGNDHEADANKNGTMTLKEVYNYVYEKSLGPYYDGRSYYYQHVQMYPANSTYPLFRYTLTGPVITDQPRIYWAGKGVTVTFKVEAEGAESYQWQWRKNGWEDWADCELSGSQTASLKVKSTYENAKYTFRCLISGPGGVTVSREVYVVRSSDLDESHKWWMDDKGNLSITGTGPIPDDRSFGWEVYRPRYVTIGSGTTHVGSGLFKGCYNLETVSLPDTVTSIGDHAFDGCKLLHTITVPKNLTSVGAYVFADCEKLNFSLDEVTLSEIGEHAFDHCGLQSIKLGGGITAIPDGAFCRCPYLRTVEIPDSVTVIGSEAFMSCGVTEVVIPDGVTEIGEKAFWRSLLTSVAIPDSVVTLGDMCFQYCERLKSVSIGKGVKSIDTGIFYECSALESISVASGNTKYASYHGALLNKSKKTLIYCPRGMSGALTLPSTLTTVKESAFSVCGNLESVTIPDGVTSLPEKCFYQCSNLTEVNFGSGMETIDSSLFFQCFVLQSITVSADNANYASSGGALLNKSKTTLLYCPPGMTGTYTIPSTVTMIGDKAFYNCEKLTAVTIPGSVTEIGKEAFLYCTGLTSVTIPDSVTLVGEDAFQSCRAMTSAKIGKGLTAIPYGMFSGCNALTGVTLPSTLKTIGEHAFYGCDLREVRLGKSVTSIGEWAFTNNLNLTDVYYKGTKTQWNKITIGEYNDPLTNATIHYNA